MLSNQSIQTKVKKNEYIKETMLVEKILSQKRGGILLKQESLIKDAAMNLSQKSK